MPGDEVTILSPADTYDRYLRGRSDGLPMPRTAYLASAVV